jgi:hypothetical protein
MLLGGEERAGKTLRYCIELLTTPVHCPRNAVVKPGGRYHGSRAQEGTKYLPHEVAATSERPGSKTQGPGGKGKTPFGSKSLEWFENESVDDALTRPHSLV